MVHQTGLARITTTIAATMALLGMVLVLAPNAMAATYPKRSPLRDAAGVTNGCRAFAVTPKAVMVGAVVQFRIAVRVRCDPAAGEWGQIEQALYEVMPDGSQVVLRDRSLAGGYGGGPVLGFGNASNGACPAGTHDYIARWWVEVGNTQPDPNPFQAIVEARGTFTCP